MTTEILREAAEGLRDRDGSDYAVAVAAWLEKAARGIDRVPDWVAPATPERVFAEAFAVARAYLARTEQARRGHCPACEGSCFGADGFRCERCGGRGR